MLYIALAGSGIAGASMQVYMSYLINFVERTLGMTDYVMPLAVIIVCSAVLAGLLGFLMDKFGRKHFFIPLVLAAVVGTLGIYLLKFLGTSDTAALLGLFVLLPMIIGPAIGNAIIDRYGWYTFSETMGEEILNYPYEMFLGAAIVAVFTLIPAVIVRSKDAETRARLLAERDGEDRDADEPQMSETDVEEDVSAL